MIALLKTLCNLDAPSGCEDAVRAYVLEQAEQYADEVRTDSMGNVMAFRRGETKLSQPVVVAAHMDEVGVIVKKICDDGTLKFGFVGGVDPRVVIGKPIRFGEVRGVVGIKAVHLTTAEERKTMPKTKDLYIDIGAKDKEEAEKIVTLGMYGAFDSDFVLFGDDKIKAKAIDDRAGCAVVLRLLQQKPPIDTWFCFTTQEETGLRGAAIMANVLQPGFCLVVEGTTASDLAGVPDSKKVCRVGGGAVVPFMDGATIYDADLFDLMRKAAEKRNIPWQTKTRVAGGTDAGRIHKSGAGARVCAVSVPVRYIHSPSGVAAISDVNAVAALAQAFLEDIGGDGE